jgi:large subunit ribosomal protein L25
MGIGDTLRLSELVVPDGVTVLDDLDETVLATVTLPTREEPEVVEAEEGEEGAAPAAEADSAEPEAASDGGEGAAEE